MTCCRFPKLTRRIIEVQLTDLASLCDPNHAESVRRDLELFDLLAQGRR